MRLTLDNIKRTRLKITVVIIIFMMFIAYKSLVMKKTDVTVIALGVISASGLMYKHVETKKKSEK